jgi:hypothetical protein
MSESRPAIQESLQNNGVAMRENPETLTSKKRVLYEIENLLNMQEKDLGLEALNSTSGRVTVSTRALYKMYKALLDERSVRPRMVFTGKSVLEFEQAEKLAEEHGKDLSDLEVTI